jgi:hypothetical protein
MSLFVMLLLMGYVARLQGSCLQRYQHRWLLRLNRLPLDLRRCVPIDLP